MEFIVIIPLQFRLKVNLAAYSQYNKVVEQNRQLQQEIKDLKEMYGLKEIN